MRTWAPAVALALLNGVGFAFSNIGDVWKAMDGDVGGLIKSGLSDSGLFVFDKMYDNGFRQITSSTRPIEKPGDLKGLAIRVPPSPLSTSLFKAFGAAPQPFRPIRRIRCRCRHMQNRHR